MVGDKLRTAGIELGLRRVKLRDGVCGLGVKLGATVRELGGAGVKLRLCVVQLGGRVSQLRERVLLGRVYLRAGIVQDALAAGGLALGLDGLHAGLDGVNGGLVASRVAKRAIRTINAQVDRRVHVCGHRGRQHEERVLGASARAERHRTVAGVDVRGVKHHAADGVRLARKDLRRGGVGAGIRAGIRAVRAVRARALLAIGGAAEGNLVAQGKAALVQEAPGHGHLVRRHRQMAVKHVGLVHAGGAQGLDVHLLGRGAHGGVAGLHPAALGRLHAVDGRQRADVVVGQAKR